jgi:deazaflavin-dependent oxidoreductase (nitroreductase family)
MPLPDSLAKFNRTVTNRITRPFAGRLPGFGIVRHTGRRSGRIYDTPVNVFRRPGGFTFALTYGRSDWVKNVLHAGSAELLTRGRVHRIVNPRVVQEPSHPGVPAPVGAILRRLQVEEELLADDVGAGP